MLRNEIRNLVCNNQIFDLKTKDGNNMTSKIILDNALSKLLTILDNIIAIHEKDIKDNNTSILNKFSNFLKNILAPSNLY